MQLQQDQVLGDYRIVEPIGAGGMGEVYRARDTRLDRDVAIKVLPQEVARDARTLSRFEREAKAIAALSHPNILAVYDFGSAGHTAFVVTELLEGETLRERLEQGVPAPRKAAELGRQIARGLAAAHDKGIVHRDLKPENVYVTREGRIKILDFGLAAEATERAGEADATRAATRTNLTAPGTVLGTVGYMSPEQVRGESVDARSDIFSLGAVLYEMASGVRAFQRETNAETMTAILKEEPPELESVSGEVPGALATIVRRCLEKKPAERFQSAHDLAFSLDAVASGSLASGAAAAATTAAAKTRPRPSWLVALGLLLVGAVAGGVAARLLTRPPGAEPASFTLLSARRGTVTNARFAAGSQTVIYSASWEGRPLEVFTVDRARRSSSSLAFEGVDLLAVSPTGELALAVDRRYIVGWEAIGTLAVATPEGSAPRQLLENVFAADWSPDGKSGAVAHEVDGVVRLEYPIGTVLYESRGWISDVRVHPDGRRVLIADNPARGDNVAFLKIVDVDGRVTDVGLGGSWGALWAPDGKQILYSSGPNQYLVRPGERPRVLFRSPTSLRLLDVDAGGDVLVASSAVRREMYGRAPGADAEQGLSWLEWSVPRGLTPDGRSLVFEEGNLVNDDGYAVYLRGTDGSTPVPVGNGTVIAISPDASRVVMIQREFSDAPALVLMPTGPGKPRTLDLGGLRPRSWGGGWLPDAGSVDKGGAIVFAASTADAPARLYRLSLAAGAKPQPLTPEGLGLGPYRTAVSPDGRRLIFSTADGRVVEMAIGGGEPVAVPGAEAGEVPLVFDRDGRHLYLQATSAVPSRIVRVDLQSGDRETVWKLAPNDAAGVFTVDRVFLSDDGTAYVYACRRNISQLALVSGWF